MENKHRLKPQYIVLFAQYLAYYVYIYLNTNDTVHEMAKDEARHGAGFAGLLKRYFGK